MEITLNKNGWHRKLQEFVFRNPPRHNSLCPYFWLTVFCFIFTFMIPIVLIIRFIPLRIRIRMQKLEAKAAKERLELKNYLLTLLFILNT